MTKDNSEEFANVNFSLFVWVSALLIVTARSAIDQKSPWSYEYYMKIIYVTLPGS